MPPHGEQGALLQLAVDPLLRHMVHHHQPLPDQLCRPASAHVQAALQHTVQPQGGHRVPALLPLGEGQRRGFLQLRHPDGVPARRLPFRGKPPGKLRGAVHIGRPLLHHQVTEQAPVDAQGHEAALQVPVLRAAEAAVPACPDPAGGEDRLIPGGIEAGLYPLRLWIAALKGHRYPGLMGLMQAQGPLCPADKSPAHRVLAPVCPGGILPQTQLQLLFIGTHHTRFISSR